MIREQTNVTVPSSFEMLPRVKTVFLMALICSSTWFLRDVAKCLDESVSLLIFLTVF